MPSQIKPAEILAERLQAEGLPLNSHQEPDGRKEFSGRISNLRFSFSSESDVFTCRQIDGGEDIKRLIQELLSQKHLIAWLKSNVAL